jgi:hypothetical protein
MSRVIFRNLYFITTIQKLVFIFHLPYECHLSANPILPNVLYERLTLFLCIQDVSGSNLDPRIGYHNHGFPGFSQFLQAYAGIVP